MNGPDHYREAERLLREARDMYADDPGRPQCIALAQAHATLALVAATAEQHPAGPWLVAQ